MRPHESLEGWLENLLSQNKIIFIFDNGSDTLTLDDTEFSVSSYTGLEASEYEYSVETNINADGATKKRMRVAQRSVSVEFDYLKGTDKSKVRQRLIRFFSPYKGGTLTVQNMGVERFIEYEVKSFSYSNTNVYDVLSAHVELTCLDPSFKGAETTVPIVTLTGGWKWKFKLPFKLKQYGDLNKDVYNSGDVETPMEIFFQGPAVNPTVYRQDSGEYISVKKELTSDDTLYINTGFRQKKVEIITNGVREDAWDYLDMTSTFFWLQPGDNNISYSHTGIERNTGVQIRYKERYLGV